MGQRCTTDSRPALLFWIISSGNTPPLTEVAIRAGSGRVILDDYLEYAREHQFVSEYLAKVDGATMYHGLEARSPFLDHQLWEYAAALPYSIRLYKGRQKAILREIAKRRISSRVAEGRKRGFEIPVSSWLEGRWNSLVEGLHESRLQEQGWLDGAKLLAQHRKQTVPPLNLWYALVLEFWLRAEESRAPHPALTETAA
jgi:asparagine synthase (glutamine-hydrolysing)